MDDLYYNTIELEDVTEEQHSKTYVCTCGWEGDVNSMIVEADCGDVWDAIYSPFCCPECLRFYLCLENWKVKE